MSGRVINYHDDSIDWEGYLSLTKSSQSVPLVLVAHTWKGRSEFEDHKVVALNNLGYAACLLYTSPSPRDKRQSRMPSCA